MSTSNVFFLSRTETDVFVLAATLMLFGVLTFGPNKDPVEGPNKGPREELNTGPREGPCKGPRPNKCPREGPKMGQGKGPTREGPYDAKRRKLNI